MSQLRIVLLSCFCVLLGLQRCWNKTDPAVSWSLYLNEPGGKEVFVMNLPNDINTSWDRKKSIADYTINLQIYAKGGYRMFSATVTSNSPKKVFLTLECQYDSQQFTPYNFNGKIDSAEIYRQSPHDVNAWIVKTIAMQAVPVIALKSDSTFQVALCDSPFKYDNFCTQAFYPEKGIAKLSSGDNGLSPGIQPDTSLRLEMDYNAEKTQVFSPGKVIPFYHSVTHENQHVFSGIIFQAHAKDLKELRKEITLQAASHFSKNRYTDYFGSLAFVTAYYNLRTNDSGKSVYWVIPAVEYGNTQYGRDAFWIATMLEPEYAAECLKSELEVVNHFAEYPLFAIIWAYRAVQEGLEIDLKKVQAYVDAVEQRVREDAYFSYWEGDGRLDFQYWGDVMAFEKDDLISYNQGLFAVAIEMAQRMGLRIKSDPNHAAKIYASLFDEKSGFYPVSKKKRILSPDVLLPDLLSQIYLEKKLLPSENVRRHFERMVSYAKTDHGFKIVSTPFGGYLPAEMYDIPGYQSQVNREKMPDGRYFRGGSYFLYDNLFLIDSYLHGIKEAEDLLKWRVGLDFKIGSTTYETLNTISGEPWKPNMGWNVAVYSFWRKLIDEGKANNDLFEMVDEIVNTGN